MEMQLEIPPCMYNLMTNATNKAFPYSNTHLWTVVFPTVLERGKKPAVSPTLVVVVRFLCTCGGRDCWQCFFSPPHPAKSQPKIYQLWITAHRASVCYSAHSWGQGGRRVQIVHVWYIHAMLCNSHTCICYYSCKKLIAAHTIFLQVWSKQCNTARRCTIDNVIQLNLQRHVKGTLLQIHLVLYEEEQASEL